jgi:hypothetical protein
MHPQFTGSKRRTRLADRDQRRATALDTRLQRIYAIAQLLHNENELAAMLSTIADPAVRAQTRTLIETFVPWRIERVAPGTLALPGGSVVVM